MANIPGSPFTLVVQPSLSVSPLLTNLIGPGLSSVPINGQERIVMQLKDVYGNSYVYKNLQEIYSNVYILTDNDEKMFFNFGLG